MIIGWGLEDYRLGFKIKSRTVVSVPRPPDIKNKQSIYEVYYLEALGAGGRGTEATVLLGGRTVSIKMNTCNNI